MGTKSGIKVTPSKAHVTHVTKSQFHGVHWDAKSVQTIQTIADAFLQNALGLSELAKVINSQNVQIECLLHVGEKVQS